MEHFDKIIGYVDIKQELESIVDIMLHPDKYKKLGVSIPHGLMLHGDPGVGKTLMSNCFVAASGRKVFICRKDKPNGDFVKQIKKVFEEAKANAPSIVFLDDIDKFANTEKHLRNTDEFVTIQSCIDDIGENDVFVLATANSISTLPDSLLRAGRFDKTINVRNPVGDDAIEIVKYYLSQKSYVDVDAEEIAKILCGKSCADLETVINEAGVLAGFANKVKIDTQDVIKACLRVIFKAPESVLESDSVAELAFHEAGHAVIAEVLEPNSINLISVCKHNGEIGGITSYYQPDNYFNSKKCMETRVISLLGGKAALEIAFGQIDVGVKSDMGRVFDIVERFVDNYCSYGFENYVFNRCHSNELLSRRETQIASEVARYYQIAKRILVENRSFLNKLAAMLMREKTLTRKQIQEIKHDVNDILSKKQEQCGVYHESNLPQLPHKLIVIATNQEVDVYCKEALRFWLEANNGMASIASIQRNMAISFNRAGRIVDTLQKLEYIAKLKDDDSCGTPLRVLVKMEDLDKLFTEIFE